MDEAAEPVAAAKVVEREHLARGAFLDRWHQCERRPLIQRAVRPVLVVVRDISREDVLEVAAAEDQQPVVSYARAYLM